jgi:hypothetical protein
MQSFDSVDGASLATFDDEMRCDDVRQRVGPSSSSRGDFPAERCGVRWGGAVDPNRDRICMSPRSSVASVGMMMSGRRVAT